MEGGGGGLSQTNYMSFQAAVWCGSVMSCDCLGTETRQNNYCKDIEKGQPCFVWWRQCQGYLMCLTPPEASGWAEEGETITDRCIINH